MNFAPLTLSSFKISLIETCKSLISKIVESKVSQHFLLILKLILSASAANSRGNFVKIHTKSTNH
jgi:hypothetical protein